MGNYLRRCLGRETMQPVDITQIPSSERIIVIRNTNLQRCSVPLPRNNPLVISNTKTEDNRLYGSNERLKANVTDEVINAYKLHEFCYNTLKLATKNFSKKNLLGTGGCGEVYKGWIDYSTFQVTRSRIQDPIAVKRHKEGGDHGREEWLSELKFLSRFHHPHIVKLIGYCCDSNHRILVYEFMPKGSLEAHLLRRSGVELSWMRRVKVAIGSAKGLEYLHTVCSVIHRDIKSSNILLDNDFNPKISDFGLAKFGPQGDKTHVTTRILGTRGYFAPEYVYTGHLTLKTDVYGFGVVLLEILSGLGAVKKHSNGVVGDLVQWAKPYLINKQELHHVIDKKLRKKVRFEEVSEFSDIILKCLEPNPKSRLTMTEVVSRLEQLERNMKKRGHKPIKMCTSTQSTCVGSRDNKPPIEVCQSTQKRVRWH